MKGNKGAPSKGGSAGKSTGNSGHPTYKSAGDVREGYSSCCVSLFWLRLITFLITKLRVLAAEVLTVRKQGRLSSHWTGLPKQLPMASKSSRMWALACTWVLRLASLDKMVAGCCFVVLSGIRDLTRMAVVKHCLTVMMQSAMVLKINKPHCNP